MQPLTTLLTRDEVAQLLQTTPELVDALLDSGRVLCHVRAGQVLIPVAQLETFFRDALIRLYQAEGARAMASPASEPARVPVAPVDSHVESALEEETEADAGESEADEPFVAEPQPAAAAVAGAPAPAGRPTAAAPATERLPDLRFFSRYVPLRPISGIFGDVKFSIVQLSATGLRIRHNEALLPGDEAKLSFALMRPARSVVVRAKVVWTSIARSGDETFSISGLRIIAHEERMAQAIETLKAAHELQPERRERVRRAADSVLALTDISDEEIALVTAAVQKFAADPVEASRWYSRARFALSDENVRRVAPERQRDREEVLGIWEYIDRQVEIPKIAGVVAWMRRAG